MTFGDVIGACEEAGVDVREAYWGGRPTDGDKALLLRLNDRDYTPSSVSVVGDAIVVLIEPVATSADPGSVH